MQKEATMIAVVLICGIFGFFLLKGANKAESMCVKKEVHYYYIVGINRIDGGSDINKARNLAGITPLIPTFTCVEYKFGTKN